MRSSIDRSYSCGLPDVDIGESFAAMGVSNPQLPSAASRDKARFQRHQRRSGLFAFAREITVASSTPQVSL